MIFGAAYDETLGDPLLVTVIATGLSQRRPQVAPLTVVQPSISLRTGTGTDNLPILNNVLNTPQAGQPGQPARQEADYSTLSTPSVWRSARTQAAAKVEALSSNGMDEIEIPAFLRKQADRSARSIGSEAPVARSGEQPGLGHVLGETAAEG